MVHNNDGGGPYRSDRACLEARVAKLEARNRLLWRALKINLFRGLRRGFKEVTRAAGFLILGSILTIASAAAVLLYSEPYIVTPRENPTVHITPPLVITADRDEEWLEEPLFEVDVTLEGLDLEPPACARPFQIFDPEMWIWIQCERRMCVGPLRAH